MAESEQKLAALARKEMIETEVNHVLLSMAENMGSWQAALQRDVARAEDLVASFQVSNFPLKQTPSQLSLNKLPLNSLSKQMVSTT
jgi:hypothetical protein